MRTWQSVPVCVSLAQASSRAGSPLFTPSLPRGERKMESPERQNSGHLQFFDAHCHLQDPRIVEEVSAVIEEAQSVGVDGFSVNGTSEADWDKVQQLQLFARLH
eukprot:evm.model.scf_403.3 EVM.evm.TU.scf_403.3   scf_403:19701-20220(+)